MTSVPSERIIVLDFGGQYAHLIASRVRRLSVYSEIVLPSQPPSDLDGARGLILSGGPSSVYSTEQPQYDARWFETGLPMLGLCYGHQLLAKHFGGEVARGDRQEYGSTVVEVTSATGVLAGLGPQERVWMSHGDSVKGLPPGFAVLGTTEDCPIAAMGDPERKIYGLQFHPEVTHTEHGRAILDSFLTLCGCHRAWSMERFVAQAAERLHRQVGSRNVFLLVSGGVDSAVAFALLTNVLGEERVIGLHIDNGFMRLNESGLVRESLDRAGFRNLRLVDASEEFLEAVKGVADPQQKRQIVGDTFIKVQSDAVRDIGLDPEHWILGQGTLYPDIIESGGSTHAAVIKTHHNRVEIIRKLIEEGRVIEPLDQLYKDEVRQVGRQLGLPVALVNRHPFPGPGLSVRCLCSDGSDEPVPDDARQQVRDIAAQFGVEASILPVRSVGVQGDARTYARPAAITGIVPRTPEDWERLGRLSTALTNTVPTVNRVVVLCWPDRLPELRLRRRYLVRERLELLRLLDDISMTAIAEDGLMEAVFQFPTILVPLSPAPDGESVVLRPVESTDVMTASFAALPATTVEKIVARMRAVPRVEAILYDITNKPPATMEWE